MTVEEKVIDKKVLRNIIAKNIAAKLEKGNLVNLGVGIPTLVSNYVTEEQDIILQAENGLVGTAGDASEGDEGYDPDVISSSGYPTNIIEGAAFFDSSLSFGIIRGGHVDVTVLGTMEVDEKGNIANYEIPGKLVTGMGGAMDLCVGAKKVIVATFHTNKGRAKLLKNCTIPLTAKNAVNMIVTEKAIVEITDSGFVLTAYNPMFEIDNILEEIDAEVKISDDLVEMII
ncbi:3-oxoacid CoA-transferase subunit B [Miniphocaeibacter massiliensis]|uniref:3-oxoacid CoA-transferase subunit B n=1 Tax=Miniphocaeibacter massiliensis TaxID=2041841 RepID=UPI001A90FFBC|nr:3-oxoacid CoA-transferase subunit B [Miniphocaeibacter massiliensis]